MSAPPRFEFVVPALAARQRHPLVREAIALCEQAFSDRFALRQPAYDRSRNVTREALHMFLARPKPRPAKRKDGTDWRTPADLERRRADHLQVQLALWVTMVAIADFDTWALLEPAHELAKTNPYPTMLRLAELADIVPPDHGLADAPDCVWRARAELEHAGMISFTKEWRVEKPDGSHYSSGGALRKLGRKVLAAVGGAFGRAVVDAHDDTKRRRAQRAQEAAEFKRRVDRMWTEERRAQGTEEPLPAPVTTPQEDDEAERVHQENPGWMYRQVLAEARRRLRALVRAGPGLADDSS